MWYRYQKRSDIDIDDGYSRGDDSDDDSSSGDGGASIYVEGECATIYSTPIFLQNGKVYTNIIENGINKDFKSALYNTSIKASYKQNKYQGIKYIQAVASKREEVYQGFIFKMDPHSQSLREV